MTYWILILLFITPEGKLLKMEQLTHPYTSRSECMKMKEYAHTIKTPKGTWFSCQPVKFKGYFA